MIAETENNTNSNHRNEIGESNHFIWLKQDKVLFDKVKQQLINLSQMKYKSLQIIKLLEHFHSSTLTYRSYSKQLTLNHRSSPNFHLLHKVYEKQLPTIFSQIAHFVLKNQGNKIGILRTGENRKQVITKIDAILILCLMALMLVPQQFYQNNKQIQSKFHHTKNFAYIFSNQQLKTRTIIQYLKKQISKYNENINGKSNNGNMKLQAMIIERVVITKSIISQQNLTTNQSNSILILNKLLNTIITSAQNKKLSMSTLTIQQNNKDIQQFYGELKTDFANKYIGGGALTHGLVQQQIMFAVHPEMYISMLLCQVMSETQAIRFYGFRRYFQTKGYNHSLELVGEIQDAVYTYSNLQNNNTNNNKNGYRVANQYITAIDALNFNRIYDMDQYSQEAIARQIVKAYAGFCWPESEIKDQGNNQRNEQNQQSIVSGNWGCGVFGGDVQLKLIIQWIAASLAYRNIKYCPFGQKEQVYHVDLLNKIAKCDIKTVIKTLFRAGLVFGKKNQSQHYNLRERGKDKYRNQTPTIYSLMLQFL